MTTNINDASQIAEMSQTIDLMRRLGTCEGFFTYYFKELGKKNGNVPKHRTNMECFNYVNDQYFDLFGEYRYSDYNSFRMVANRFLRKKRK